MPFKNHVHGQVAAKYNLSTQWPYPLLSPPEVHKIDREAILTDPSALHNTAVKFRARKEMMEGKQTEECRYCWNIENLNEGHISDRMYKSADKRWSFPFLEEVEKKGHSETINPRYLEVIFENSCNLKCAYCTPDISSEWMKEILSHGPYPTSWLTGNLDWIKKVGKMPIPHGQENPYIDAFWRWWPDLIQDLRVFRISGGEPLLSRHTWRCIEEIINASVYDLDLAINSNLCVPEKVFKRLLSITPEIVKKVNSFEIYTSCEAAGQDAEYIRFGMNYSKFMEDVETLLKETPESVRVNFMITFNALSLPSFIPFLKKILSLRKQFNKSSFFNRIPIMISYLHWPPFLSMRVLPKDLREKYACKFREFAESYTHPDASHCDTLYLEEYDQIHRLCDFMLQDLSDEECSRERKNFASFIDEYDRRRGTNFIKTFPELEIFLLSCRKEANGQT